MQKHAILDPFYAEGLIPQPSFSVAVWVSL